MVKDQLFKKYPTNELFNSVLSAFGIHNVDHASREDLASNNLTSNLTGGGISDGESDWFFFI